AVSMFSSCARRCVAARSHTVAMLATDVPPLLFGMASADKNVHFRGSA
ncbi:MAG: hypothetical protein ACI9W2_005145, partial [Gammaproteobacteria bacterium]